MDTQAQTKLIPKAGNTPIEEIYRIFELQKKNLQNIKDTTAKERKSKLKRLQDEIFNRREEIKKAVNADFRKAHSEVDILEIYPAVASIRHTRKNLSKWMKPKSVPMPSTFIGSSSEVRYEPRGNVLIISPWNYPFYLCIEPLVSAIAAGNAVIIKPSEFTPNTSAMVKDLLKIFPENEVAVVEGDHEVGAAVLDMKFDHIFFTGSPNVGKIVMREAAKNLTSITLELGGKSPVIVDKTAKISDTVEKIAWGKLINNGQTCLAPDYLLVHEDIADKIIESLIADIGKKYNPNPEDIFNNPDYCRIVNQKHHQRVAKLIEDAVEKGAEVKFGGLSKPEDNFISPTILTKVPLDSDIMQEEIFGPVLPVFTWKDPQEALKIIHSLEKPLALYVYTQKKKFANFILQNTTSGGALINDNVVHVSHPYLPFGGVNHSGIGNANNFYGFKAFSHERAVMRQTTMFTAAKLMQPPYNKLAKRMIEFALKYF